MYIISKKLTNARATNSTSTVSINCHSKDVRYKIDSYILHTDLLVITLLLFVIVNIYYHYVKHR